MSPKHVGFLATPYQALDEVGPADLFNSCSRCVLQNIREFTPVDQSVLDKAPDIVFHHVGETLEPVDLTAGYRILPTTTCDECPPLDYLVIGGTNPLKYTVTPRFIEFIRAHHAAGKLIFTTCTGALTLAETGLLNGRNATVNHLEFEWAKKTYPQVKWTKEQKWVVEENLWTGSGAVAGMDMISHWMIQTFGLDLATAAFQSLDFEPRDITGEANKVLPQRYDDEGKRLPLV